MGAGGINQRHGVEILLKKRWKRQIIKTEHVIESMITTAMKCHQRRIELASVYFSHPGYADVHIQKMHKCIENHCNKKKNILRPSRALSTLSLDLVMTLNVTTLECMQWGNATNVASG